MSVGEFTEKRKALNVFLEFLEDKSYSKNKYKNIKMNTFFFIITRNFSTAASNFAFINVPPSSPHNIFV